MANQDTDIQKQAAGAVTAAQIETWKDKYRHIYKTTIGDISVIWRKLRRKEYVETMVEKVDSQDTKIFDRQDEICRLCVLFPENINEIIEENGGISGAIADEILLKSGFDVSETEEL